MPLSGSPLRPVPGVHVRAAPPPPALLHPQAMAQAFPGTLPLVSGLNTNYQYWSAIEEGEEEG